MQKIRNIYYDATFQILAPHRGMATYLNGLVNALSSHGEHLKGLAPSGVKSVENKNVTRFGFKNILLWEQLSLSKFINNHAVDLLILPYNTGPIFMPLHCKTVLILHDLIFMEPLSKIPLSKNPKQIIGRFYRRATVPRIVRKSDFIITVSEYSKSKIIEHFKIDDQKIAVLPNCIDVGNKDNEFCEVVTQSYFLNVGGDAPHKNTVFLIKGYAMLPADIKAKYGLKIVGISNPKNRNKLLQLISSLNEEANIIIENFVDDEELEKLYRNAFIFLFPSLTEGFGIPLLEAMKFGCSIACSNTSSMPEVCKEAAFYFNPCELQDFVDTVTLACNNNELRLAKKMQAIKRVQFYSRNNFNKKVIDLFNKL